MTKKSRAIFDCIEDNPYAKRLYEYLSDGQKKFVYEPRDEGRYTFLIPVGTKNIPCVSVIIDVHASGKIDFNTGFGSADGIDSSNLIELHERIERVNSQYAFSSFYLDEDSDIRASYNFFMNEDMDNQTIERYLYTFVSVCEDAGPSVLRELWNARFKQELKTDSDIVSSALKCAFHPENDESTESDAIWVGDDFDSLFDEDDDNSDEFGSEEEFNAEEELRLEEELRIEESLRFDEGFSAYEESTSEEQFGVEEDIFADAADFSDIPIEEDDSDDDDWSDDDESPDDGDTKRIPKIVSTRALEPPSSHETSKWQLPPRHQVPPRPKTTQSPYTNKPAKK